MIPIYRKIRKKMADDNRPLRYMRYAVGEILLVVIGILIALQINNWNENRKSRQTVNHIYSIVKSDLQEDIKGIDEIISFMKSEDTIFKKVISNSLSVDEYKNNESYATIILGYPDLVLKNRGLKLLENNSTIFNAEKDSLSIRLTSFYSYYNKEIQVALLEMTDDFHDNYFYWKNNMPWFNNIYGLQQPHTLNEDIINYLLSSDYRTRVGSFYLLHHMIYLELIKGYKKDALMIIEKINRRIE